jgi:mRNA-degrading endonuclease toxin of MazEF toxin-antitoxin module
LAWRSSANGSGVSLRLPLSLSWIDHNPQAGREMKDHHPFLVLSTAPFHASVGLVVGGAMPPGGAERQQRRRLRTEQLQARRLERR